MTRPVVTVGRTVTIRVVANLMRDRTNGGVPVVDGEHQVSIVTVSDLLEALGRGLGRPAKETWRMATLRVLHRRQRRAGGAW